MVVIFSPSREISAGLICRSGFVESLLSQFSYWGIFCILSTQIVSEVSLYDELESQREKVPMLLYKDFSKNASTITSMIRYDYFYD